MTQPKNQTPEEHQAWLDERCRRAKERYANDNELRERKNRLKREDYERNKDAINERRRNDVARSLRRRERERDRYANDPEYKQSKIEQSRRKYRKDPSKSRAMYLSWKERNPEKNTNAWRIAHAADPGKRVNYKWAKNLQEKYGITQ